MSEISTITITGKHNTVNIYTGGGVHRVFHNEKDITPRNERWHPHGNGNGDKLRDMIKFMRGNSSMTRADAAVASDCSKEYVGQIFRIAVDNGILTNGGKIPNGKRGKDPGEYKWNPSCTLTDEELFEILNDKNWEKSGYTKPENMKSEDPCIEFTNWFLNLSKPKRTHKEFVKMYNTGAIGSLREYIDLEKSDR